jgi:hypothetical protein
MGNSQAKLLNQRTWTTNNNNVKDNYKNKLN